MDTAKIKWHEIFGAVQQEHLAAVQIQVLTEFPITSQPPRGDILLLQPNEQTGWTEKQRAYLPDGLRDSLGQHHILELKYTETVNQEVFEQVIGYHYLYRQTRQLTREQVRSFVLSSHTTDKTTRRTFGYTRSSHPGVYHSSEIFLKDMPLILLNELSDEPHNVFFKLFGSQNKAKLAAAKSFKQSWLLTGISDRLYWLVEGLLRHWSKDGGIFMKTVTPEMLLEVGREITAARLPYILPHMSTEELAKLLGDSPFAKQLQTQGEEKGEAKGQEKGQRETLIKHIVRTLVIRFQADRALWEQRLPFLTTSQLDAVSEIALLAQTLPEFEAKFWQLNPPGADTVA